MLKNGNKKGCKQRIHKAIHIDALNKKVSQHNGPSIYDEAEDVKGDNINW
jgi:hypothetical protein